MQAEGGAPLNEGAGSGTPGASDPDPAPGSGAGAPWRLLPVVLGVAGAVVLVDQVTKALAVSYLAGRDPVRLLGGLVTLTFVKNPGAAFSLGTGLTWVFTAIAIVVTVVIVRTARTLTSPGWAVALGALLGGALGNLLDRLFREPGPFVGHVIDWISLRWFPPVFNLADTSITFAVVGMLWLSLRGVAMEAEPAPDAEQPADGPSRAAEPGP